MIQHHKSTLYHSQANGTIEEFNKIIEKGSLRYVIQIVMIGMKGSCYLMGLHDYYQETKYVLLPRLN